MTTEDLLLFLSAAVDEYNASDGGSGDGDRLAGTVTFLISEAAEENRKREAALAQEPKGVQDIVRAFRRGVQK